MKIAQTPAAILMLSASTLIVASSIKMSNSPLDLLGLVYLVVGLVIGTVASVSWFREMAADESPIRQLDRLSDKAKEGAIGPDHSNRLGNPRTMAQVAASPDRHTPAVGSTTRRQIHLSPEVSAQLALAAHIRNEDRDSIVNRVLLEHLPRFSDKKVA